MLIEITQQRIDEGEQDSCTFCPIANAIADLIDSDRFHVSVGAHKAYIRLRGEITSQGILELPYEAQKFIREFDVFKGAKPFSFQLDIPSMYLKTESNDASQNHAS